ncbi:uncharacterized protein TNCV_1137961 [Trichonephila clavipes]|nr:uncharacterized protein TNCV_1137961 [Trichonephila clavipes]
MPVAPDPCSCQPDCLVCGWGEVPSHDCAIHVLLESMLFQERMLHGEPTEERLEDILQSGKEYLPRAMTDQNSTCGRLGHVYKFTKRFDTLVIQGKDVLPGYKSYAVMTQKSKLVTTDVVFNILNAEMSSLATSVATNAGVALVEGNPDGGELQIVSRLARSRFSRSVLVQNFIEKVMRRTVTPVECPAEPWMDFLVNEVSSRIPPLITRCDKSIQTDSPNLHFQPIGKTPTRNIILLVPNHHPLLTLDGFILQSGVMRRVSRRPELPMEPGQNHPVKIPLVPEPPVQIPDVPEPPVQIPHVPEPVQIPEPGEVLHVPEPMQIPEPVQILHVPEPMQIPQSSTLWNSTLWSRRMHSTSSCRSYLDPQPKNSSFTRYPLFFMVISSHSWMNLKGSWRLWT